MHMPLKQQRDIQNGSYLQNYSEESQSLVNSRKRLNCEASQGSSQLERDNQNQIRQFRRQIEERFKISIANKIYTFPKYITSIHDLISSSESQSEQESSLEQKKQAQANRGKENLQFKKKNNKNIEEIRVKHEESPSKYKNNGQSTNYIESVKKVKDKMIPEFGPKRKQQKERREQKYQRQQKTKQDKTKLKIEKASDDKKVLKKSKTKTDRLKTENESSKSFIQTMKGKPYKKN